MYTTTSEPSFLWYDYETFGLNPQYDRPAQFAAIRTDRSLQQNAPPIMHYCRLAEDYLPDPLSCLIHGITPQHCQSEGLLEPEFAAIIKHTISMPQTISVGYNSIRFDEIVTRFLFWRNLIDPYAHTWMNQCGRWDLLNAIRAAYALRPQGIIWPTGEDGNTTLKLEALSIANGIEHSQAHDALSDVQATIALASLLKKAQPKLFDFCLNLCSKEAVREQIGWPFIGYTKNQQPRAFLHVSGQYSTAHACLAIVWPIAIHPHNQNELIVWDLRHDPQMLLACSIDEIKQRLFTKTEALPEGTSRLPIKTIHINQSPVVASQLKVLDDVQAERAQIDWSVIHRHTAIAERIHAELISPERWEKVYTREDKTPTPESTKNVDIALYQGGFLKPEDKQILSQIQTQLTSDDLPSKPLSTSASHQSNMSDSEQTGLIKQCAQLESQLKDPRLPELCFFYRARNFPSTLSIEEKKRWQKLKQQQLTAPQENARNLQQVSETLEALRHTANAEKTTQKKESTLKIISAFTDYIMTISAQPKP